MADPTTSSPLLNDHEGEGDDRGRRRTSTWVQKLVDVEETKAQIIYSLPMILTNLFYYCIPMTSVMFASHLGQLELAGGHSGQFLGHRHRFCPLDKFKETWTGFSLESIRYVVLNLTLSIPSAAMVCLEYWVFEILVFLAGVMPNPENNTSLVAICYMLTYGVSAVASTRVSNELGAGNVKGAKKATYVSVKLSLVLALGVVIAILVGHDGWVELFSDSLEIKDEFASLRFFLVASITLDSIPGVLSGVARGCGWQCLVTVINLGTFYLIEMPIAAFCGFKLKFYAKGLWFGLICGMFCQSSCLLLMTIFRKWTKLNAATV